MKNAAVILSGCGVYDGSEIHESVFSLLALSQNNISYQCFAPNKKQHHVINHLTGEEIPEERNVLIESGRIARGDIKDLKDLDFKDFDALVIPGGFGAAKNLNQWALKGPDGAIDQNVKQCILDFCLNQKAILALCMGPTVVAQALASSQIHPTLTVGSDMDSSPYDIAAISNGMSSIGSEIEMKSITEIAIDSKNRIISAPCYMMEGNIVDIHDNIQKAVKALADIL